MVSNRLAIANASRAKPEVNAGKKRWTLESNIAITKLWMPKMATFLTPEEAAIAKRLANIESLCATRFVTQALNALKANDLETARQLMVEKVTPFDDPG